MLAIPNSYLDIFKEDIQKIDRLRRLHTLKATPPLLMRNGKPIIEGNSITIIQGKAGSTKSSLAQLFCSQLLKIESEENQFGLEKGDQNIVVCYADTERNTSFQFPFAIQSIVKNAGYDIEADVENLEIATLLRIPREYRFLVLAQYIESIRKKHEGKYLFIVLDVITDCITNFNDPTHSLGLIDLINNLINEHDVSVLAIIHENPGTDKARGHLGTELLNKSTTQIQVNYAEDKDGQKTNIIEVNFLKCRNTGKIPSFYLSIDENRSFINPDEQSLERLNKPREEKAPVYEIVKYLQLRPRKNTLNRVLLDEITALFTDVSDRTISARLREIEVKEYNLEIDGKFHLLKSKKNKSGHRKSWYTELRDSPKPK